MLKVLFYFFSITILLLPSTFPISNIIFYILLISVSLVFLIESHYAKFDFKFIILLLFIVFGLVINDIPAVFNAEIKFISYFLVIMTCSSLFYSNSITTLRTMLFSSLSNVSILICVLSFFGLITGLIPRNNPNEVAGGFSGLYTNSITFGCLLGVTILISIDKIYNNKSLKVRNVFSLLVLVFLYELIISGSRAALGSMLFGALIYIVKINNFSLIKFFRKNFVYIFLLLLVFVIIIFKNDSLLSAILNKNEASSSNNDVFYSRRALWDSRINEFWQSPIFGIGFNTVDLSSSHGLHEESGTIESGSSWLFILSSLGIVGFLIYFWIIFVSFIKNLLFVTLRRCDVIYLSILAFFILNMSFEGYVFATSNVLTYYLFLSLYFLFISNKNSKI